MTAASNAVETTGPVVADAPERERYEIHGLTRGFTGVTYGVQLSSAGVTWSSWVIALGLWLAR
jgi:hypothetical protein